MDPEEVAALQLENARLRALQQFPQADQELINELSDPAQITRVAQRTHESAARFGQQQRQGAERSPNPPANSDPASTEREMQLRRWRTQVSHNLLRKQVDITDAEMAQQEFFKEAWNEHMRQRRESGSFPESNGRRRGGL